MAEFKYDIVNHLGSVDDGDRAYHIELNEISWNGRKPTYDLRKWTEGREKMSKGFSLDEDELRGLHDLLNEIFEDEGEEF